MSLKKIIVVAGVIALAILAYWQLSKTPAPDEYNEQALQSMAFRQQILHASDLIAGVADAVKAGDKAKIHEWQQKAIEVAKVAELETGDIEFISSEEGRDYLLFHAKRRLFNQAFETKYYALEDIDELKKQYPQAKDLFAEADRLIAARDAIIIEIASELSEQSPPDEATIEQAKRMWQERFSQQAPAN